MRPGAWSCLEVSGGVCVSLGTRGQQASGGHGTTRWQQHFASGSGVCRSGGGCQAIPACPGPLPLPAPLPTCLKGGEERHPGGRRRERSQLSIPAVRGPAGLVSRRTPKDPRFPLCASVSLLLLSRRPWGPHSLHHTAAQLTGKTRARDLEKPTPGIPWRLSPPPQALEHPHCPRVPRDPSPAPSWWQIWASSAFGLGSVASTAVRQRGFGSARVG